MSFLQRIRLLEPEDTWSGFELALEERFFDALSLATNRDERRTAAIYLFGYVAELVLKIAYFRFTGVPPAQPLGGNTLRTLERAARRFGGRNLHDLEGLMLCLIEARSTTEQSYDSTLELSLRIEIQRIQNNWLESIRYKYTSAQDEELEEVFAAVSWLYQNRFAL